LASIGQTLVPVAFDGHALVLQLLAQHQYAFHDRGRSTGNICSRAGREFAHAAHDGRDPFDFALHHAQVTVYLVATLLGLQFFFQQGQATLHRLERVVDLVGE
jgi:hypothetical protein